MPFHPFEACSCSVSPPANVPFLGSHLDHKPLEKLMEIKPQSLNFWSPVSLWVAFLFRNLTISGWFLSTVSVQNEKFNIPLPSFLCAGCVGVERGFLLRVASWPTIEEAALRAHDPQL